MVSMCPTHTQKTEIAACTKKSCLLYKCAYSTIATFRAHTINEDRFVCGYWQLLNAIRFDILVHSQLSDYHFTELL